MKIRKYLSMCMAVLVVFGAMVFPAYADSISTEDMYSVTEPYAYPMEQDSDEWRSLETAEARKAAFSVPDELIDNMTTAALYETVITNPYFADIWAFDSTEVGIEVVSMYVDGLSELITRPDFASVVEQQNTQTVNLYNADAIDDLSILKSKLMVEVCATVNESSEDLVSPCYTTTTISTPYGSGITAYYGFTFADHGMTMSYARTEHEALLDNYPDATVIRDVSSATAAYNCHSYAWYTTSSTNKYWFDDPTKYMTDGSYTPSTTSAGDKIYWKTTSGSPVHSGIVYSGSGNSTVVTSKWGPFGLIRHNVNDCPYSYASWSTFD